MLPEMGYSLGQGKRSPYYHVILIPSYSLSTDRIHAPAAVSLNMPNLCSLGHQLAAEGGNKL